MKNKSIKFETLPDQQMNVAGKDDGGEIVIGDMEGSKESHAWLESKEELSKAKENYEQAEKHGNENEIDSAKKRFTKAQENFNNTKNELSEQHKN
ncbi:MAG: hypothetical protein OEX08_03560 [Candidatus Nomurabacteria bacterium]|nr:hypothetical protein [Candidatus Nomurabacteria bacterium]